MNELLYKDRRREGESVLRQCQLVQLHLLHVLDKICRENKLVYLLEGGTLLGAMRHNGFIPWDDDLDVGMPRPDYEKFLKIAASQLPSDVFLHKPSDTPRMAIPYAKLRDAYSFYCERRPDLSTMAPSGIFIDIFPYEDMPTIGRRFQVLLARVCASSWMRTKYFYNHCGNGLASTLFFALVGWGCSAVHFGVRLTIGVLNMILPSKDYYLCLESGFAFPYPKGQLFPVKTHVFEDGEFPIPNDADAILTAQYGDWRQVPPPEKRPQHAKFIDPFHSADGVNFKG